MYDETELSRQVKEHDGEIIFEKTKVEEVFAR